MFTESHEIEPNSISGIECMKYVLTMNGGIKKNFLLKLEFEKQIQMERNL